MHNTDSKLGHSLIERLWREDGTVVTVELVLVSVVALIGFIVAFSSVRDSVVSEFVDTSLAVQNTNQSLVISGLSGVSSATAGSNWNDASDPNDGADIAGMVIGTDFTIAPQSESSLEAFLESNKFQFKMTRGGATWTGAGSFVDGQYTGTPYWPGTYTVTGSMVTVVLDAIGGNWTGGTIVLDGSDTDNITGNVSWVNTVSGFVWQAIYELCVP